MAYKIGDKVRLIKLMQIDRWSELEEGMVFVIDEVTAFGIRSGDLGFLSDQIELVESEETVTITLFEYENLINCKEELDNLYEHDMIKEID